MQNYITYVEVNDVDKSLTGITILFTLIINFIKKNKQKNSPYKLLL